MSGLGGLCVGFVSEGSCGDLLSRRRVSVLRGWLAVPQMLWLCCCAYLSGCIAWDLGLAGFF